MVTVEKKEGLTTTSNPQWTVEASQVYSLLNQILSFDLEQNWICSVPSAASNSVVSSAGMRDTRDVLPLMSHQVGLLFRKCKASFSLIP